MSGKSPERMEKSLAQFRAMGSANDINAKGFANLVARAKPLFATGLLLAVLGVSRAAVTAPEEPMSVWFDRPGGAFYESSVVGNGRLGAMDLGGVDSDRIVLNESSVWSGGPYDGNNYDAYKCLPAVREKFFAGDIAGAGKILWDGFTQGPGVYGWNDENQFGCYQTLGDLNLKFDDAPPNSPVTDYRRDLNLMTGVATTRFTRGGVT